MVKREVEGPLYEQSVVRVVVTNKIKLETMKPLSFMNNNSNRSQSKTLGEDQRKMD